MQFLSISFIILWMFTFSLYYLVPKRGQCWVLLLASMVFYLAALQGVPFHIIITSVTTYACGRYLQSSLAKQESAVSTCEGREEKKRLKAYFAKRRKVVQILYISCNLALLVFYKYAVTAVPVIQRMTGTAPEWVSKVVMPLGISFYTLTAISYVIDVGRENCKAEENFGRLCLILFYFPAITQGPFHRFRNMREQFIREHDFSYERLLRGIQRFVWGAFKKLVIADRIGIFVDAVYGCDTSQTGGAILALATMLYMLQLYADFSGYIDMAMGVSETLDIELPENFRRPFFSRSVAEFWRRWHITLGTWFKDYVMFSFVMSNPGRKIGKFCKRKWENMGRHVVPIIGTMAVWFLTGIWHGRTVTYILWGVYYGLLMSVSLLLEPRFAVWKDKLCRLVIREGSSQKRNLMWLRMGAFAQLARTWVIVFIADVMIRSSSVAEAAGIYGAFFTRFRPEQLLSKTLTSYGLNKYQFLLLFGALLLWLAVSVLEEKGHDVRILLATKPVVFRWACYYGIVIILLVCGIYGGQYDTAVFMYQSF